MSTVIKNNGWHKSQPGATPDFVSGGEFGAALVGGIIEIRRALRLKRAYKPNRAAIAEAHASGVMVPVSTSRS